MIGLKYNTEKTIKKLNRNLKTRNRIFITASILIVLLLIPFVPFWVDISKAMKTFGIGHYHTEKEYLKNYGNETAGINIELDITLERFSDIDIISKEKETMFGYFVLTSVSMIASENIESLGFTFKFQLHGHEDVVVDFDSDSFDPPHQLIQFTSGYQMEKGALCKSAGLLTYQFLMGSIVCNETIEYQITYIIPYGNLDYYNFNLIFYMFLYLYLVSIGLIPLLLYKIIKPSFGIAFEEEDLERQIRFREYMDKKVTRI